MAEETFVGEKAEIEAEKTPPLMTPPSASAGAQHGNGKPADFWLIDAIRHQFHQTKYHLTVPEWPGVDGQPLTIYWKPLTYNDEEAILARIGDSAKQSEHNVMMLIMKAEDADGKKLFRFGDKMALMAEAQSVVINRIVFEIYRTLSADEAKKNSGALPN